MKIQVAGLTDVGRHRAHNEDDYTLFRVSQPQEEELGLDLELDSKGLVLFLADGMGGANSGEVASQIAKKTIRDEFAKTDLSKSISEQKKLNQALIQAHKEIVREQKRDKATHGMGTTAILAWILEQKVVIGWSGDSRAYLIRDSYPVKPLTDDHSLVWDMVLSEKISAEDARSLPESNIILQCLGDKDNPPKPDFKSLILQKDDILLLCSDGLNGMIPDEKIFQICRKAKPIKEIADELVFEANEAGGHDNITVILAKIIDAPERADTAQTIEYQTESKPKVESEKPVRPTKRWLALLLVLIFSVGLFLTLRHRLDSQMEPVIEPSIDAEATQVELKDKEVKSDLNPLKSDSTARLDLENNRNLEESGEEAKSEEKEEIDPSTEPNSPF